jgi:peptide/nickel transport system substrate-binding protein
MADVHRASGRRHVAVLMLACATLLLAGHGGSSSASAAATVGGGPAHGGALTVDIPTAPIDLDVDTSSDNESIWALEDMAEGLFRNAANGRSVVPWLATSYKLSPDKLTWTFQLRRGVRFSDGRPMTSKDVVWSLTQAASPKDSGNSYIDAAIKSVAADGPYAVTIRTKVRWAPLPADLAMYVNDIFPARLLGQGRAQFFAHPIGTGPFEMSRWVKGRQMTLVRNPNYWQTGKPYLGSLTLRAVPAASTRIANIRRGRAQIIEEAPFARLRSLRRAGLRLGLFPSSRIDYVTMNEQFRPFKDVHVRLAVAKALNRQAIMKKIFFGHAQLANSPFMPGLKYYRAVGLPARRVAAARAELAKSHYPRGGFTVDFIAARGDPIQVPAAHMVAEELAPLRIKVRIRLLSPSRVEAEEHAFNYGMRETYWTNDIVDPDEYTAFTLCGSASKCGGVYANFTHFDDPRIDKLTVAGETILGSEKRAQIYGRIQQLAAHQIPMVWLGYSPFSYVYSPSVRGYHVSTQGNTHFENVWLSR